MGNGRDVSKPYWDTSENRSPYAHFTPQELYYKFLYESFRDVLNRPDELDDILVPDGFKRLKYQEEAVLNARRVLEEYGGLFLADVVGLGKTYMAALLAQQLEGRSLVIAPPHLLDKVVFLVQSGPTSSSNPGPPGVKRSTAGSRGRHRLLAHLGGLLGLHRLSEAVTFAIHLEDVALVRQPIQ